MDKRGIAGTLFATILAGGVAAVTGATASEAASPYFDALMYGGAAAILIGLLGLIVLFLLPDKKPPQPQAAVDQSVSSYGQSGGVTARTVMAPPERGLDANSKAQLLERVPQGKPIEVEAPSNDAEAGQLAEQIVGFLRDQGFNVTFGLAMGRPFPRGVEVHVTPEKTAISVGRR